MFKPISFSATACAFLLLSCFASCSAVNATDYTALIAFRSQLVLGTDNILSMNWTSNTHYCTWFGVSCRNQRVTRLRLSGLGLGGDISPQISNMTHLVELNLNRNGLGGILPSELGSLQRLRILNVSRNSLQGGIPVNLSRSHRLLGLDLSNNYFVGTIPQELGSLSNLRHLALHNNNLTGNIPASFGNFSRLEYFYLHENDLEGAIPSELGKLSSLSFLRVSGNNLTGSIPLSIFNISTLQVVDLYMNELSGQLPENLGLGMPNLEFFLLDSNRIIGQIPTFLSNASKLTNLYLSNNDLHGELPNDFGRLLRLQGFAIENNLISGTIPHGLFNLTSLRVLTTRRNYLSGDLPHDLGNWLPNLQHLIISHNQFTGPIPSSISNATNLLRMEVSHNNFSGPVPMMFGNLVNLVYLNLQNNQLTNNPDSTHLEFLNSLANCRGLQYLIFDANPLNAIIPESVGNLSTNLIFFIAMSCELKGRIPCGFGNLSSLNFLALFGNNLEGEVPSSFSSLQNLERISLSGNKLEGSIPTAFCSIGVLGTLDLGENRFSGPIPTCIQNLTELRELSLAANKLNSTIPLGFWNLDRIQGFNFSRNLLHGYIPVEVGGLTAVYVMDLSSNNFSGEIPNSIGSLQNLLTLDMSRNEFQGQIPSSLSNLIVIESIDLSSNNLNGDIPESLGSLRDLQSLNLSFNRLQGEIPNTGVFSNITFQSLMGNPNLCGAPNLNFPVCTPQAFGQRKQRRSVVLKITVPIAATAILVVTMILLWIKFSKRKSRNATETVSSPEAHQIITYHELVRATENFGAANLVGEGSSGVVYKGELSDGTLAAIKVFNTQYAKALKNFDVECGILSEVRHRNLVKIISTCTNLEFKAMILEFMPNGSLDKWLHSQTTSLTLAQRLDIMIDVALAMEYLHHEYMVPIVHCDLKPANVLLDKDMTAHVADFGISKTLAQDQEFIQTKTLGTIGYMAPEYGTDGHTSTMSDVYSFGILLLETFTGKRPTDDMFIEDLSLHRWVYKEYPNALIEVLDSNLFSDTNPLKEGIPAPINKKQKGIEDILMSIIHVAFLCLEESPDDRSDMRGVAVQLKKIRAELKKSTGTSRRRLA